MSKHRQIVEKFIGRKLTSSEIIHHINGDPSDNRIENLQIMVNQGEHVRLHLKTRKWPAKLIRSNFHLYTDQISRLKELSVEWGLPMAEIIRRAIDEYIISPIPINEDNHVSLDKCKYALSLSKVLKHRLDQQARKKGLGIDEIIRRSLDQYLDDEVESEILREIFES